VPLRTIHDFLALREGFADEAVFLLRER